MMESSFARTRLPNRHNAHALKLNSILLLQVPTLCFCQASKHLLLYAVDICGYVSWMSVFHSLHLSELTYYLSESQAGQQPHRFQSVIVVSN